MHFFDDGSYVYELDRWPGEPGGTSNMHYTDIFMSGTWSWSDGTMTFSPGEAYDEYGDLIDSSTIDECWDYNAWYDAMSITNTQVQDGSMWALAGGQKSISPAKPSGCDQGLTQITTDTLVGTKYSSDPSDYLLK
jgi:hypothetical protein